MLTTIVCNDDSDGVSKAGLKDEGDEGGSGSGSVEQK